MTTKRTIFFRQPPAIFNSLDEFLDAEFVPSGNIEIKGPLPIHLYWSDRQSTNTLVAFTAALKSGVDTVPVFGGHGTTKNLEANVLLISDPSLLSDTTLNLAWYLGNETQPDTPIRVTRIIKKLARNTKLVMFGPSGGGYAALEQAKRLTNSTVIACNPQVDVTRYHYFETYIEKAWGSLDNLPEMQQEALDLTSHYSRPLETRVIYIQNRGDYHLNQHWRYFYEASNAQNPLLNLLVDLGKGHVAPDKESFSRIFQAVCSATTWMETVNRLSGLEITRS